MPLRNSMNQKLAKILVKHNGDLDWPSCHVRWWLQGTDYGGLFITETTWHLLWKHGKPRRMRKAK